MLLKTRLGVQRLARTIMFVAISAFMLQGVMVSVSRAAAATGMMPEAAVTLSGSLHYHGQLAGHVHDHGDESAAGHVHHEGASGHVHGAPEQDHDDQSAGFSSYWSIFTASIAIPTVLTVIPSSEFVGRIGLPSRLRADGIEPAALTRPPSTLSIA
ncbi:MAG: hypothetical protein Q8M31_23595 [Beijerinckiaceae bacterium]|nr:hypothetical protein [Beijerinckiaceae bacterium]